MAKNLAFRSSEGNRGESQVVDLVTNVDYATVGCPL